MLTTICDNIRDGDPDLNPSIGTYLNDENAKVARSSCGLAFSHLSPLPRL